MVERYTKGDRRTWAFWEPICQNVEDEMDRLIDEVQGKALEEIAYKYRISYYDLERKFEQYQGR